MDEEGAWIPDTGPRRRGCAPEDLAAAVGQVRDRYPSARLVRNRVGNLSVVVDGEPAGYVDLTFGRFEDYAKPSGEAP